MEVINENFERNISNDDYRKIYNNHMKCCNVDAKNIRIDKRGNEFTNAVFDVRSIFCIRILPYLISKIDSIDTDKTYHLIVDGDHIGDLISPSNKDEVMFDDKARLRFNVMLSIESNVRRISVGIVPERWRDINE